MSTLAVGFAATAVLTVVLVVWCSLAMSGHASRMEENAQLEKRSQLLTELHIAIQIVEAHRRNEQWDMAKYSALEVSRLCCLLSLHDQFRRNEKLTDAGTKTL